MPGSHVSRGAPWAQRVVRGVDVARRPQGALGQEGQQDEQIVHANDATLDVDPKCVPSYVLKRIRPDSAR